MPPEETWEPILPGVAQLAASRQSLGVGSRSLSSRVLEMPRAVAAEGSRMQPSELVLAAAWKEFQDFPLEPAMRAVPRVERLDMFWSDKENWLLLLSALPYHSGPLSGE